MIDYQLVTTPAPITDRPHLIGYPHSPLLTQAPLCAELLDAMQETPEKSADCRFGCAPFGRITLLAHDTWQDTQTGALCSALRSAFAEARNPHVIIDCGLLENDAQALPLFHFLFCLDYQLADQHLKTAPENAVRVRQLSFWCRPQQQTWLEKRLRQAAATAQGMNQARRLADMPSDRCTPAFVADRIAALTAEYPQLSCEVLDEAQIARQGLGLLHAVGKGAANPPRLLVLRYDGCQRGPLRAYVGKGVTFDSGGLWLKGGDGMYTMKYDMCGAANVFGLLIAAAELQLPVRLTGILALAENMIGPNAMRPGDVVTSYAGHTVEINNTDAEGRLVLADGIAYAARLRQDGQPARYIIDVATLTGAVVKALGYELSGLMTEDEALRAALTRAGKRCGDEVWSLPLDKRFDKQVDSNIADLCNTPTNNAAISTSAARFLSRFCPETIPWAHLDVSGSALWREKGYSVASGRPIPLLIQHLLDDLEN